MRIAWYSNNLKFYVGNMRDYDSIHSTMHRCRLLLASNRLETGAILCFFRLEAVRTNILGTGHVLPAAISRGVKKVIVDLVQKNYQSRK